MKTQILKITYIVILSLTGFMAVAQVKAGDNPEAIGQGSVLELESADKALVITRVANTTAVAVPVNGMMVYDVSSKCLKAYENGRWTNCLSNGTNIEGSTNGTAIVTAYTPATAIGTLNTGMPAVGVSQNITAQVSQPGTYNIQAIGNGVVFSASGVFTTSGPKALVLTASGSPIASGAFNYILNTVPSASFSRVSN